MLVTIIILCFLGSLTGFTLILLKMRKIANLRKKVQYTDHHGKEYGTLGVFAEMSTETLPLIDYLGIAVLTSLMLTLPILVVVVPFKDMPLLNLTIPFSILFTGLTIIPLKRKKDILLSNKIPLSQLFTKKSTVVSFRSDGIKKKFDELEQAVLSNEQQLKLIQELNPMLAYWEAIDLTHYSIGYDLKRFPLTGGKEIEMLDRMKELEEEMDAHIPFAVAKLEELHGIYYPNPNNNVSCNLSTLELEEADVQEPIVLQVGEQEFADEYVVEVTGQFKFSDDYVIHHIGGFQLERQAEIDELLALVEELKKHEPENYGTVPKYEQWFAPASLFESDWNGISDVIKRVATDWTIDPSQVTGIPARISDVVLVHYDVNGNKTSI